MNCKLNSFIIFAAGAVVGSVVTWKLIKTRYEQIAQEEIDSVKEIYAKREHNATIKDGAEVAVGEESTEGSHVLSEMRGAYAAIAKEAGYINPEKEEDTVVVEKPYIIVPDDFDMNDYNTESLNYYADGVLTDYCDNVIDDPENIIGDIDPSEHFGEYEEDTVYVRNDVTKCDYEILRDTRNYSDYYPSEERE